MKCKFCKKLVSTKETFNKVTIENKGMKRNGFNIFYVHSNCWKIIMKNTTETTWRVFPTQ